ncbi:MAG: type II toxin-antitoxin system RelE/ParE family toxin [Acaryochloridaceae cyanobacterium CSU_3_4]|nr:type II toxin-antitoxin system RelE/ParE family toxin [Acaryochloridaceae cyanobacterium CSU_3_4]
MSRQLYSVTYNIEVIPQERTLKKLETSEGKIPFDEWYLSLSDQKTKAIIAARLIRIQLGNMGDVRSIGSGVFEFRIHYGPGFRIYFADVQETLVILLAGGDKRTQKKDIKQAIALWETYQNEIDRYIRDF